ncbi:MAG: hypothetical protein PSY14_06880 [bacterium]|nr:hypothetical protein [bacterium]
MTFKRRRHDAYFTPAWPVYTLLDNWRIPQTIWDPAAGDGGIARPARRRGHDVVTSDIKKYPGLRLDQLGDFRTIKHIPGEFPPPCSAAIVANPPYAHPLCEEFIAHALQLLDRKNSGIDVAAFLLRSDYSHAPTFRPLFEKHYACRLDLTQRIRWIAGTTERPRHNHSWFIFDRRHRGPAHHIIQGA